MLIYEERDILCWRSGRFFGGANLVSASRRIIHRPEDDDNRTHAANLRIICKKTLKSGSCTKCLHSQRHIVVLVGKTATPGLLALFTPKPYCDREAKCRY